MELIYGSTAIKHWYPDFREPNDFDIITEEKHRNSRTVEYYWTDAFEYLSNNIDLIHVDSDLLYTIKVSHAAWNIKWEKTMKDIQFLKNKGCTLNEEFFSILYKDWEILHGKKKVNLNKSNYYFFKEDSVTREHDHDYLHEFFAFNRRPLHEKIRPDRDSPMCSKELFYNLTPEERHQTALEEIYVIAYERFISKGISAKASKVKALKQLITTMTKGWFNLYLIENSEQIIFDKDIHFNKKLKELRNL